MDFFFFRKKASFYLLLILTSLLGHLSMGLRGNKIPTWFLLGVGLSNQAHPGAAQRGNTDKQPTARELEWNKFIKYVCSC